MTIGALGLTVMNVVFTRERTLTTRSSGVKWNPDSNSEKDGDGWDESLCDQGA